MIDARLVAATAIVVAALNVASGIWHDRHRSQYSIPDGKALRCEVVDKDKR